MEPEVWGDESEIVTEVVGLIARRITRASHPKTTARPASELVTEAGRTITPAGLGAAEALSTFEDVLVPATRAQDGSLQPRLRAGGPDQGRPGLRRLGQQFQHLRRHLGSRRQHPEVFAVVASAGTTNTNGGVVDDIADLAEVCTQFEPFDHAGQPGHDLGKLLDHPAAAQLGSVVRDRLEPKQAFALM